MFNPARDPEAAMRLITLENRLRDQRGEIDNLMKEAQYLEGRRKIALRRILETRREMTRIEKGE